MSSVFNAYREPRLPAGWDAAIVLCTVASLAVVFLDSQADPRAALSTWLDVADLGFCAVFLADYGWRLSRAQDRGAFVRRNWLDLLSSLPLLGVFRAGRVLRVVRLLRVTRIGFIRRAVVDRFGIYVSGDFLNGVVAVAVAVWLSTATLFYAFEYRANQDLEGFGDALWWSITTLSTVGYGDLYPVSFGGRLVAAVTMVLGVGVVGTLAATIATAFIDIRERGRRGLRGFDMHGHLLVLGWNDKSEEALEEFRADLRYENTPVLVLGDRELCPSDVPGVRFVRGVPGEREALERASAGTAAAAIAFAADPNDPRSDHETALTILALRRLNPTARISAELVDARNREHIIAAGCDSVVHGAQLASAVLIRSVQDSGVSEVVAELLSSKRGAEIYRAPLKSDWEGLNYGALLQQLAASGQPLLGLARGHEVHVHPDKELVLEAGDELFLVGRPADDV